MPLLYFLFYFIYQSFQLLHSIMQDNWEALCVQTRYFTFSKYLKMKSGSQSRLLWLVDKLVALQARGVDSLCMGLIRQIKGTHLIWLKTASSYLSTLGGNHKGDNIFLITSLLQIFTTHLTWFYQQAQLIPFVVFSFIRIVSEAGLDNSLRKCLSSFCATVLRDKYQECSVLGRDLVRILGDVSKISEFDPVWSFLQSIDPSQSPDSSPLLRLLKSPTPKHFFASRLTPDMETNLIFMLEKVKYGHHKRYQEWFTAEYLSEEVCKDPYPIIVDIIRYLIVAYHPPNTVIASPSVQRWHAISWLIRLLKANFAYANAKMALFYDYLFYDPLHDSIMNIEPAILLIVKSVSKLPFISSSMLEFLYLARRFYYPTLSPMIEKCIDRTMVDILSKRVIPSLESIFLSDQIPEEIKQQTKEMFPCYLGSKNAKSTASHGLSSAVSAYEHPNQVSSTASLGTSPHRTQLQDLMTQIGKESAQFENPRQGMTVFINAIGLMDSFAFEAITGDLVTFVQITLSPLVLHQLWREALLAALKDSATAKDVVNKAIERLGLLPVPKTCFDIEALLYGTQMRTNESVLAEEIVEARRSCPESFYRTCFKDFGLKLLESENVIECLYLILEDCDPIGLLQLKQSLLGFTQSPILSASNWTGFMQHLEETVLWDGYVQLFFWDLMSQSLRCSGDTQFYRQFVTDALKKLYPFLKEQQKNAELCSAFYNLCAQFLNFTEFNDFYFWFALFVEEMGAGSGDVSLSKDDVLLSILMMLWRVNSRFFLQCLVRVDEANQPRPINHGHIRHGLLSLCEFVNEGVEPSPAKKSLCACLETTLTLLKGRS